MCKQCPAWPLTVAVVGAIAAIFAIWGLLAWMVCWIVKSVF